jgi:hypothetical protein
MSIVRPTSVACMFAHLCCLHSSHRLCELYICSLTEESLKLLAENEGLIMFQVAPFEYCVIVAILAFMGLLHWFLNVVWLVSVKV